MTEAEAARVAEEIVKKLMAYTGDDPFGAWAEGLIAAALLAHARPEEKKIREVASIMRTEAAIIAAMGGAGSAFSLLEGAEIAESMLAASASRRGGEVGNV